MQQLLVSPNFNLNTVQRQPSRQIPRDYQLQALADLRTQILAGHRSLLLVAPTGSGKTSIAAELIHRATQKQKRIVFLANRRELIDQCSERLDGCGVDHGIIQANHWRHKPHMAVQVASVPTLVNRELSFQPDILITDECHRARAASYESIFSRFPQAIKLGLTATPIRSDGKGLGNLFTAMVQCPSVAALTEQGYLVPMRVFAPANPDLSGVKKTGGDYNQGGIQRAMDKPVITGDIVAHWQRLASDRITVLFAAGIEHSIHLRDAFRAAGVAAEHLDGETDTSERDKLLAGLADGRIRVLCSVGVLTEGWDSPAVSCAILARPTASTGLFLQMCGRILRPAPGKTDALLLDHAGCTLQHGFVDDEREWTLDVDSPLKSRPKIDLSLPRVCPECFRVARPQTRVCECGYVFAVRERSMPDVVAGDLEEITVGRRKQYTGIPEDRRKEMYLRWAREGAERGWKASAAWMKYRSMFGTPPKTEWMLEATAEAREIALAVERAG